MGGLLGARLRREFPGLSASEVRAFGEVWRAADRASAGLRREALERVAVLHARPAHPDWPRDPGCPCVSCRDRRGTGS